MYLKKSYVKSQSCPRLVIHYDWLKITVCEDRVLRMCPLMEATGIKAARATSKVLDSPCIL